MSDAPATTPSSVAVTQESATGVPTAWLFGLLAGWLLLDQCLLWLFLGHAWAAALGTLTLLLAWPIAAGSRGLGSIAPMRVAICIAIAAVVLVVGGEGHWFYANTDWQVRDAVLRDMAIDRWPFAYLQKGEPLLLRAPLGMYLLPALAWKAGGEGVGTCALLIQNSILIGVLLALGSQLFGNLRSRAVALAVMLGFSGLDWVGNLLFGKGPLDHLEAWAPGLQYSSTITLAFWVPQHAFAGWLVGLAFVLYRAGKIALGPFLAIIPLFALWSPLALIGAMPWAALAGWLALAGRRWRWRDLMLPAMTSAVVLPVLRYLSVAGDSVGTGFYRLPIIYGLIFLAIEILPWALPALMLRARSRFGSQSAIAATAILAVLPFLQVGSGIDLMMRASVPALTVLALCAIEVLVAAPDWRTPGWHWWLAGVTLLALPTGAHELARAFMQPVPGKVRCNLVELWNLAGPDVPNGTYLAPLARTPDWLAAKPVAAVPVGHPGRCWDGPWYQPVARR